MFTGNHSLRVKLVGIARVFLLEAAVVRARVSLPTIRLQVPSLYLF